MHAKTSSRAAEQLDDFDRILLGRLQQHIPLIDRPFSAIAAELESDEERVLNRARALTGEGLIRETSGIFDSARLGYRSTLVAARYAEERLVEAAALVSSHPGVSHNYRRDHAFNLWYTLAVPPGTSLEASVDELHLQTGAQTTLLLPALRTFKLGVQLAGC